MVEYLVGLSCALLLRSWKINHSAPKQRQIQAFTFSIINDSQKALCDETGEVPSRGV